MRLMKYSFICPICDKSYYTYVEQKHFQEMFDHNISIEDNFIGYPDYYLKMIKTSICPKCQQIDDKTICLDETDSRDDILYNYIQELEKNSKRQL